MQDEEQFFRFLRESPKHGTVLNIIAGAVDLYQRVLPSVVGAHDLALQQDIALVIRFLKKESSDRVAILSEHLTLDWAEKVLGESAVKTLCEHQRKIVTTLLAQQMGPRPGQVTMEHLFESAGLSRVPAWGVEHGRAAVGPLAGVRLMRHEVFHQTREVHRAYHQGKRQESWRHKLKADAFQKNLGAYSDIAQKSSVLRMVRELHGDAQAMHVLRMVNTNTRMSEYEVMRNRIQAAKLPCRIYSRSARAENRKSA